MNNYRDIIKAPIITEKTANLNETNNTIMSNSMKSKCFSQLFLLLMCIKIFYNIVSKILSILSTIL